MKRKPIRMLILSDIGADALRTAIVKQAVDDYVHGCVTKNKSEKRYAEIVRDMNDAEEFLKSDWAEWLVDVDCKTILRKVKERMDEKSKEDYTESETEDL